MQTTRELAKGAARQCHWLLSHTKIRSLDKEIEEITNIIESTIAYAISARKAEGEELGNDSQGG